jgi:hypothetical protein
VVTGTDAIALICSSRTVVWIHLVGQEGRTAHHKPQDVRQRRWQLQWQRRTAMCGGQKVFHARGRMAQQPHAALIPDVDQNPAAPGVRVVDVAQAATASRAHGSSDTRHPRVCDSGRVCCAVLRWLAPWARLDSSRFLALPHSVNLV